MCQHVRGERGQDDLPNVMEADYENLFRTQGGQGVSSVAMNEKSNTPSCARKSTQLTGFLTCRHFFNSPVSISQKRIVSSYEPLMRRFPISRRISTRSTIEARRTYRVGAVSCSSSCVH